jgi:aminopeptidase N
LIAGPYYHVHDEYIGQKTVPLGIYCRKSLAESLDPEDIFLVTKQGFAYFEKVFGLAYPFEKYDQIAVVDFNWGAMENSGAVTFLENLLVFRSKVTERMYDARARFCTKWHICGLEIWSRCNGGMTCGLTNPLLNGLHTWHLLKELDL